MSIPVSLLCSEVVLVAMSGGGSGQSSSLETAVSNCRIRVSDAICPKLDLRETTSGNPMTSIQKNGCNDVQTCENGHTRVVLGIETWLQLWHSQHAAWAEDLQEPIRGKERDDLASTPSTHPHPFPLSRRMPPRVTGNTNACDRGMV
ncbi:hypothetical protein BC629DRAFT_1564020 [Irpex lacteus]|nr:hypothetical protein BC629DRAFT_1564020 [Irpex lacteus]